LALGKTLLLYFSHSHFNGLVFLIAHHLLHALSFEFLSPFLNRDHLLMLSSLSLQSFSLTVIFLRLCHLLITDGFFLVVPDLLVSHLKFTLLLFALLL
jgi:hypothetical protein